jgi:hypothetical protein
MNQCQEKGACEKNHKKETKKTREKQYQEAPPLFLLGRAIYTHTDRYTTRATSTIKTRPWSGVTSKTAGKWICVCMYVCMYVCMCVYVILPPSLLSDTSHTHADTQLALIYSDTSIQYKTQVLVVGWLSVQLLALVSV